MVTCGGEFKSWRENVMHIDMEQGWSRFKGSFLWMGDGEGRCTKCKDHSISEFDILRRRKRCLLGPFNGGTQTLKTYVSLSSNALKFG